MHQLFDREVLCLPFLLELEFENDGFGGEGKTGVHVTGEKSLGAKERIKNKLNPLTALMPGFETGPHWWEGKGCHQCTIPCSILNNCSMRFS